MNIKNLDIKIDRYINSNWNEITKDIASLIKIPSFYDKKTISKKYPSGKAPAQAVDKALEIAKKMGFKTKNFKNIIGIADIEGTSKSQIGFIGHLDVVPPGPGWRFDPFNLSITDNYMIGRGIIDDKGPVMILLHAINFWKKQKVEFPHSVRFLFGTNEESGSSDVDVFKENFEQPTIVITPDADFPICYGEKGLCRFKVISKKISNGVIDNIKGGVANNAVAGIAQARIKLKGYQWVNKANSRLGHAIDIEEKNPGFLDIIAHGRSAHAAIPYNGIDSIAILSQFLLEKNIGNKAEQEFLNFVAKVAGKPDGRGFNINCRGEHLSRLTIVPSMLKFKDNRFEQTFDIRYPEVINVNKIKQKIKSHLPQGAKLELFQDIKPMLLNPQSKFIMSLSKAFEKATKLEAKTFTMGGATYARDFDYAASFGPIMEWEPNPAWVGSLHGPDEGIKEEVMKKTFKIYVYAIKYLMELDLDAKDFFSDINM